MRIFPFVVVSPGDALIPVLIVVGLLLFGGLFFLGMLLFNREALDAETSTLKFTVH